MRPMRFAADRDAAVEIVVEIAGGVRKLADRLDMAHATISRWKRIPKHRVSEIERLLHIPRHELRPDLYPPPRQR